MPFAANFTPPGSVQELALPDSAKAKFFIAFISSADPATNQPWCPDVRAALPHIKATFGAPGGPEIALVEVGQRPEWRSPSNVYRNKWNISAVPTLVRYQRVDGEVTETGRLVEDEILNEKMLKNFVGKPAQ